MKKSTLQRLTIMGITVLACCLLAACSGAPAASSSNSSSAAFSSSGASTSGSSSDSPLPSSDISGQSILLFNDSESSAKLVADMEAGRMPVSCNVMYDEMGSRPDVEVTDAETITKIYNLLAQASVDGASDMSITDSYHYVIFTLQDGSKAGFRFEGDGLLYGGKTNYAVSNIGGLWSYVKQLQEEKMGKDF